MALLFGDLAVRRAPHTTVLSLLPTQITEVAEDGEEGEGGEAAVTASNGASYDYLLSMSIYNLTREKIAKLQEEAAKAKERVEYLCSITGRDMWAQDLDAFEAVGGGQCVGFPGCQPCKGAAIEGSCVVRTLNCWLRYGSGPRRFGR